MDERLTRRNETEGKDTEESGDRCWGLDVDKSRAEGMAGPAGTRS